MNVKNIQHSFSRELIHVKNNYKGKTPYNLTGRLSRISGSDWKNEAHKELSMRIIKNITLSQAIRLKVATI